MKLFFQTFKIPSFDKYWIAYGGFKAIGQSPYFRISLLIAFLFIFGNTKNWFDIPLAVLPNILGFSVGSYAILLALGNSDFWKLLTKKDDNEVTPYMEINATFVHFIIMQLIAIMMALFSKLFCLDGFTFTFIGLFFFIYALLSTLAAVLAILTLSSWYQDYLNSSSN